MRLDFFLPILRKPVPGRPPRQPGLLSRIARKCLPNFLLDDREKIRPGFLRRTLKRIGPVTLAAPWRRAIQAACFAMFVLFFFYICWPYSASPAAKTVIADVFLPAWVSEKSSDERSEIVRDAAQRERLRGEIVSALSQHRRSTLLLAQAELHPQWVGKDLREIARDAKVEPADIVLTLLEKDPAAALWRSHYADDLASKEKVHAELFLIIDPLVAISTALASKTWEWSLWWALGILAVCLVFPRGFCGYLCPLGTLIDFFDWAIGKRVNVFRVKQDGWWVNLKYYVLVGILVGALCGVLISGFFSAIPIITRGFLFLFDPLQTGIAKGWHQVPPLSSAHILSIVLFFGVLALGFLRKRFWCRYVCPSGAVFSAFNLFRVSERKVETSCIGCNKCIDVCPFDAIKADWTTRTADCTLCQTCGGVCPTHAIKFVERWNLTDLKNENDPPVSETPLSRRGFLLGATAGLGTLAVQSAFGADLSAKATQIPVNVFDPALIGIMRGMPIRPPGSVPEDAFHQMCIRCGECFKACPNHVLQPEGFQQGLDGLWTPLVKADWAGCESACNNCGQVCPTGAIRALPIAEKRVARIGLAFVNEQTCLPYAGKEACQMCVDECTAAGYNALEFRRVGVEVDNDGLPVPGSGFAAPVVLHDKCVGCGLCQSRCHNVNVKEKHLLSETAILIVAGEGRRSDGSLVEDRLHFGSYIELRRQEAALRADEHRRELESRGIKDENTFNPSK